MPYLELEAAPNADQSIDVIMPMQCMQHFVQHGFFQYAVVGYIQDVLMHFYIANSEFTCFI